MRAAALGARVNFSKRVGFGSADEQVAEGIAEEDCARLMADAVADRTLVIMVVLVAVTFDDAP